MKRRTSLILTLLLVCSLGFMPTAKALTGVATITTVAAASEASVAFPCKFHGIILNTDGTNNVTLNIYDNASAASGKVVIPTDTVILGAARTFSLSYDPPIRMGNGIYVDVSVAGAGTCAFQVLYGK